MIAKKLKDFLDSYGVKYVAVTHSPAFSAQEVAASVHVPGKEMAKTVIVNIKGDLAIANSVVIMNDAHVVGDVRANDLEITKGAAVQGRLLIRSSENRPDPFSEF